MIAIVSPGFRNAEARWLEKARPRDFSVSRALEAKGSCSVMSGAADWGRTEFVRENHSVEQEVSIRSTFAKCSSWWKKSPSIW
jgi:hypothetical protein